MFPAHQLQLEQLACQRGDRVLFTDLSLQFQSGDFVQIEGHNGIGKTSLLRILAGLAQPVEGKVRWNSDEITKQREEYHHQLLYLGHHSGVKPELTAWENLKFYQQISQSQQGTDIYGMCWKQWAYSVEKIYRQLNFQLVSKSALPWRDYGSRKHLFGFWMNLLQQ